MPKIRCPAPALISSAASVVMTGNDIRQVTRTQVRCTAVCVHVVVCVSVSLREHVTPCRRHCDIKLGDSASQTSIM